MSANKPKVENPGIPFTFKRKKFRGVQLPARGKEFKPEVEAFLNSLNREWRPWASEGGFIGILLRPHMRSLRMEFAKALSILDTSSVRAAAN